MPPRNPLTGVFRMFDDSADGVLDFVRVFPVDVVFANGDGVMRRIGGLCYAMTGSQNPVLAQDGTTASREGTGT